MATAGQRMVAKFLSLGSKHKWNELVCSSNASGFMQSWEWSELKKQQGQTVIRIGLFDESDCLIGGAMAYLVPTAFGSSPLQVPHGPVLPWNDPEKSGMAFSLLTGMLKEIAEQYCAPIIRFEPFLSSGASFLFDGLVRAPVDLIPTPTRIIDLKKPSDTILRDMTSKGRYNIRLALRHGVMVKRDKTASGIESFYDLLNVTAARHNFICEPVNFFNELANGPASSLFEIFIASFNGIDLAAALVVIYGNRATYLYGGSSPFLKYLMAPYALHWEIMQHAKKNGCTEYDLFGIAPEEKPNHPYTRFSKFKARFGGMVFTPIGAHDLFITKNLAKNWFETFKHISQSNSDYVKEYL